ncbi:MAG: hypothetical protein HYU03_01870 [Thaumarchaeota archaeon]|nr:hypothetical protein [Nitrososphaerota archaeon]
MSELVPPVACSCGETRTRRDDSYVLTQQEGRLKPVYSNSKFVCIGCGRARFEMRLPT